MTTVIADATPMIYCAAIGQFDLLGVLYGRIVIPCAVYDEVVIQGAGRPGATETAGAAWVDRVAVSDPTKAFPHRKTFCRRTPTLTRGGRG